MYQENEKLILLQNVGKEGKKGFIAKDTEVTFIKAVDDPNNLARSMVVIQFEDRQLALPELAVKPRDTDTIDALKEFNNSLMKSNSDLKRYHHNPVLRIYYRFTSILYRIFIAPIKNIITLLTKDPKSDKKKDEALVKEMKALMSDKE